MEHDPDLHWQVNVLRSEIPAVTHVSCGAELHETVDEPRNPQLYRLFEASTGSPAARCW